MFRRMRPWVCNWNKTVAKVMALWFWWRVINPTRSTSTSSPSISPSFLKIWPFVWTTEHNVFHLEDLHVSLISMKLWEGPFSGCWGAWLCVQMMHVAQNQSITCVINFSEEPIRDLKYLCWVANYVECLDGNSLNQSDVSLHTPPVAPRSCFPSR